MVSIKMVCRSKAAVRCGKASIDTHTQRAAAVGRRCDAAEGAGGGGGGGGGGLRCGSAGVRVRGCGTAEQAGWGWCGTADEAVSLSVPAGRPWNRGGGAGRRGGAAGRLRVLRCKRLRVGRAGAVAVAVNGAGVEVEPLLGALVVLSRVVHEVGVVPAWVSHVWVSHAWGSVDLPGKRRW